jgi:hypothetical protein
MPVTIEGGELRAEHWSEVRLRASYPGAEGWFDWWTRWPNFSPEELACRGTGALRLSLHAVDRLQALRSELDAPMIVLSAYRSESHNRHVGGAPRSRHLLGCAFDVSMLNHDPAAFEAAARRHGFAGFGFYPGSGFMHLDTGPAREWGRRFAPRASRFVGVGEETGEEVAAQTRPAGKAS